MSYGYHNKETVSFLRTAVVWAVLLLLHSSPSSASRATIDSLNSLGRDYLFSNIVQGIALYGRVAEEARVLDYLPGEARALQLLGVGLYLNGRYEESADASLDAIRIFEELGLRGELAMTYGDLGYQMKRRDMARAKRFMQKGIAIAEVENDSLTLCTLYDNYGVLYEMTAQPDSATYMYRKALDLRTALNDSVGIPFSLNKLATVAMGQGELATAEDLLRRSDARRQALNDVYGMLLNSVYWGDLYDQRGDLELAAAQYNRSLRMPGAAEQAHLIGYCHERLAIIYERMQDYSRAYESHKRFTAIQDSLVNVETNDRLAALEIGFETEKKDRLLAENRLTMAARSRQILALVAIVGVLLAVGVFIARYQQLKQRQLRSELELGKKLRAAEYKRRMADEKLRISRELHDNIGAQLTFMTSTVDNLSRQSEDGNVSQGLDSLGEFGRRTLGELRETIWAMKSEEGGIEALTNKLQDLKRQCGATGRKLEIDVKRAPGSPENLSSGRMLNLFRIAQEGVQNALKHTGQGPISLQLAAEPEVIVLSITDRGPGFDIKKMSHVGGISNIRQRCADSGGRFELRSDSSGTEICCSFPSN